MVEPRDLSVFVFVDDEDSGLGSFFVVVDDEDPGLRSDFVAVDDEGPDLESFFVVFDDEGSGLGSDFPPVDEPTLFLPILFCLPLVSNKSQVQSSGSTSNRICSLFELCPPGPGPAVVFWKDKPSAIRSSYRAKTQRVVTSRDRLYSEVVQKKALLFKIFSFVNQGIPEFGGRKT